MMLLGLIRHGVTEWNALGRLQGQQDTPLSDAGRLQALELGARLPVGGWDKLYSSDLARAAETARLLSEAMGLAEVNWDVRLRERSFGPLEGTTLAERELRWGAGAYTLPGVETAASVAGRAADFCASLLAGDTGVYKRVLAVSHGAFIKLLLTELLGGCALLGPIDNASLTLLAFDGNEWRCLLYNGNGMRSAC
jgi:probable phosphoglycerate mutase